MRINGSLDIGGRHAYPSPIVGQNLGIVTVEGVENVVYPRGSVERKQTVRFYIRAWQALGGGAVYSATSLKYLLKQVEELASNAALQPCYIEWTTTGESGANLNAIELHDGWYILEDFEPLYQGVDFISPVAECRMTATEVSPGAPHRISMGYAGGALSSNYSGLASNLIAAPIGSSTYDLVNFTRTGAEGVIPMTTAPVASPMPILLSTTLANIFKGGVHVYDTINTTNNPVPTTGGTFVNANWVEVFYTNHAFVGDCVITNGLQLFIFQIAQTNIATVYLWNTATATANWQTYGLLRYYDNATAVSTLRSYTLTRVGAEESSLSLILTTSTIRAARVAIRLQRGHYEGRIDITPLTEAMTGNFGLDLNLPSAYKVAFNSTTIGDGVLGESSPPFAADYGYGAAFVGSSAQSYIAGFLYQNEPASQPFVSGAGTADVGYGDTASLAINATRSYGFFAVPYGVNGVYSPANLQAEAESGTLGTGWTSQANVAASAGNEAKCASGTVATNADTFGTAFVPDPGSYDVWFRVKVTTNAGSALEMTLGLWNSTDGTFVAAGSTTFNRTSMTTSYAWYRAAAGVTPTATKSMRFRAVTALTLGTDWFVDEAVLVPKALASGNGVQNIWQQFMYDRSVRMLRP